MYKRKRQRTKKRANERAQTLRLVFWGGKTIALIHKSALMRASVTTLGQMWLSNNRNVEKV